MKFDSPHFDRIRVKPDAERRLRRTNPVCEWRGCEAPATHRAPKGRQNEREYWRFCLAHVREYNHSYNFFAGMSDDAIATYQKESITGHRPTWKIGMNSPVGGRSKSRCRSSNGLGGAADPFDIFQGQGMRWGNEGERPRTEERMVRNAERKALHALGLENGATKADIKTRFKALVKRHHPDANGGDRSSEDRLRAVIQAYNYLKSVGYC
ncbi:MAG TPA: J domain-containing protein [Xanthobacteraceae bacterium]|nr:J domain-containing protein [Xanthobacteraceae bacterium]